MRDNPEGGEFDPAEGVRRRSMKNSPSVYPAQVRGQEKAVAVAAKSGQFTAGERRGRASSSDETDGIWQKRN